MVVNSRDGSGSLERRILRFKNRSVEVSFLLENNYLRVRDFLHFGLKRRIISPPLLEITCNNETFTPCTLNSRISFYLRSSVKTNFRGTLVCAQRVYEICNM